jgi:hypothetical protein
MVQLFANLSLIFKRKLLFDQYFEEVLQGVPDMQLNKPELLVTLILEDLAEQSDIVVFFEVGFDSVYDGGCPLDDQGFEAVALVQVDVHVGFHCLSGEVVVLTFLVKLNFLGVDV